MGEWREMEAGEKKFKMMLAKITNRMSEKKNWRKMKMTSNGREGILGEPKMGSNLI